MTTEPPPEVGETNTTNDIISPSASKFGVTLYVHGTEDRAYADPNAVNEIMAEHSRIDVIFFMTYSFMIAFEHDD